MTYPRTPRLIAIAFCLLGFACGSPGEPAPAPPTVERDLARLCEITEDVLATEQEGAQMEVARRFLDGDTPITEISRLCYGEYLPTLPPGESRYAEMQSCFRHEARAEWTCPAFGDLYRLEGE